jgi:hypothetical protein
MRDLMYLDDNGALGGISDIIAARRSQIEKHGYDVGHDLRQHGGGWLMMVARQRLASGDRKSVAQGAALAAAHLDREAAAARVRGGLT